jgi:DnaJ-class molecular chaperone
VTRAYDILTDTAKRAQYDRGEIDEEGNPKMPFGWGRSGSGGAGGGFRPGAGGSGPGGYGDFPAGGETADLSDIFEGLFGGAQQKSGPFGGFAGRGGRRSAPPSKGADVGYRLAVSFADAATLADQRVALGNGKTISIKLPKGVEEGAKIRLAGQGQEGPAGPGDAIVTIYITPHRFFTRDGDNIRLDLPSRSTRRCSAQGEGADRRRYRNGDGAQGLHFRQGAAAEGQGDSPPRTAPAAISSCL